MTSEDNAPGGLNRLHHLHAEEQHELPTHELWGRMQTTGQPPAAVVTQRKDSLCNSQHPVFWKIPGILAKVKIKEYLQISVAMERCSVWPAGVNIRQERTKRSIPKQMPMPTANLSKPLAFCVSSRAGTRGHGRQAELQLAWVMASPTQTQPEKCGAHPLWSPDSNYFPC